MLVDTQCRCYGALHAVDWNETKEAGKLAGGEVVRAKDPSKGIVLRIGEAGRTTILNMEHPGISKPVCALTGEVSYENVKGDGYIEMLNHFPDGSRYFTRTIAASGPLAVIRGTSGWHS
jgi:hypothetical protein